MQESFSCTFCFGAFLASNKNVPAWEAGTASLWVPKLKSELHARVNYFFFFAVFLAAFFFAGIDCLL